MTAEQRCQVLLTDNQRVDLRQWLVAALGDGVSLRQEAANEGKRIVAALDAAALVAADREGEAGLSDDEKWSLRDKALWSQSGDLFAAVERILAARAAQPVPAPKGLADRVRAALAEATDPIHAGGCHYRHQQGDIDECNSCAAHQVETAVLSVLNAVPAPEVSCGVAAWSQEAHDARLAKNDMTLDRWNVEHVIERIADYPEIIAAAFAAVRDALPAEDGDSL